jgi:hypothetical protein
MSKKLTLPKRLFDKETLLSREKGELALIIFLDAELHTRQKKHQCMDIHYQ